MRDELVERLPALPQGRFHVVVRPVEEAGGPALLAQRGRDLDHEPRLAEPARPVHQPARGGAGGIGAPGEESGLHAGHVRIGNDAVAGLQELDRGNVARVAGQLALLGVDQPVAVLAEIEFVQGDAGRDRRPLHHLGDGGEDSPMLRRVIDMMDVERLRDVPELHVHRPYIDELAGFQRAHGLRIDIIRDHRAGRPDHDDHARAFQRGLDLRRIGCPAFEFGVPPHRARAILRLDRGG